MFHTLQRAPEFVVWQLPRDIPICVFAVCDGFESKLALPDMDRMASCLANPGQYLDDANAFDGTVFEACRVVTVDGNWQGKSLQDKVKQIRRDTTLPDAMWQEAHEDSCDALVRLLGKHGRLPTLAEDPQAAVEAAVNVAVMLLSDDNVTAELVVID